MTLQENEAKRIELESEIESYEKELDDYYRRNENGSNPKSYEVIDRMGTRLEGMRRQKKRLLEEALLKVDQMKDEITKELATLSYLKDL